MSHKTLPIGRALLFAGAALLLSACPRRAPPEPMVAPALAAPAQVPPAEPMFPYTAANQMDAIEVAEELSAIAKNMRLKLEDLTLAMTREQRRIDQSDRDLRALPAGSPDRVIAEERARVMRRQALEAILAKLQPLLVVFDEEQETAKHKVRKLLEEPAQASELAATYPTCVPSGPLVALQLYAAIVQLNSIPRELYWRLYSQRDADIASPLQDLFAALPELETPAAIEDDPTRCHERLSPLLGELGNPAGLPSEASAKTADRLRDCAEDAEHERRQRAPGR